MASVAISASLHCACTSHHITNRQPTTTRSLGPKQVAHVVTLNVDGQKGLTTDQHQQSLTHTDGSDNADVKSDRGWETESSASKFMDERWKKGKWDLNMFVKDGKMNWDALIEAEAKRRKFLELYAEASANEESVVLKSCIIPWWARFKKSYMPEAELINGRAAMVGFFMSYVVDALTGLDMVGQTGNFICRAGTFCGCHCHNTFQAK